MSQPTAMLLALADGKPASAFPTAALGPADPFGQLRQVAYLGTDGLSAGIVQASGDFVVEHYPHIEMLVVHAGQISVQDEGQTLVLGVGASVVIGRGTALRLQAEAGSLWAFCASSQADAEAKVGLTPLVPYVALKPSQAPDAEILLSEPPQCRSHNAFADSSSNLLIGVWDSTPYRRRERPHKVHELMHLLEGRVTLRLGDATELQVNTGDTVFVTQGAPCAWESSVYVRKLYVVK
ncbi:cupin [Pseudomonas oryzihabitans]|nr:cupin [Pseudomonas psychrotolerans]